QVGAALERASVLMPLILSSHSCRQALPEPFPPLREILLIHIEPFDVRKGDKTIRSTKLRRIVQIFQSMKEMFIAITQSEGPGFASRLMAAGELPGSSCAELAPARVRRNLPDGVVIVCRAHLIEEKSGGGSGREVVLQADHRIVASAELHSMEKTER